jgi:hypothetical protein
MVEIVKVLIAAWDKAAPKFKDEGFEKVQTKCRQKKKTSAEPNNRLKINKDSEKLTVLHATVFHHIVAKALYLVKRIGPNALLVIAFLTTSVLSPDIDDWKKLKHLIKYFCSKLIYL